MTIASNLQGVSLKYDNGASCPSSETGAKYSFTINVYCEPDTEFDYIPIANGDECAPYVNVATKYGCSVLDVDEIWEYIGKYEDFFGVFAIIAGFFALVRPLILI